MKALVADDSGIMRKIIRLNLERLGIKDVLECANGKDALAIIASTSDLILVFLDINMPILDGLKIAQARKARNLLPHATFVGISDNLNDKNKETFRGYDVTHFVGKPFNLNDFNMIVEPIVSHIGKKNPHTDEVISLESEKKEDSLKKQAFIEDFLQNATQCTLIHEDSLLKISNGTQTLTLDFHQFIRTVKDPT